MIVLTPFASLPMYDWPEIRQHTDRFWRGLAMHAGFEGLLDRTTALAEVWRKPNMVFSQTCGYPFTHEFNGLLNYVATPHYEADGCAGADYCSFIFARKEAPLEHFRGQTAVINNEDSMSGMLALKAIFAPLANDENFFGKTIRSGGHLLSLRAVREGKADVCATDAVCVALAKKYRPQDLEGLVEVARSPLVPGLPYVTRGRDVEKWRIALQKTFADPDLAATREALLLKSVSDIGAGAYKKILDLEAGLPPLHL
ncbi:MAG: PhnD/SsuA/transferrin family substrate-binding protein [Alphaproteobacteria bacterium]|nr:PhnD/SsuA/transferrin family substrate-binding protein [Alphaproteobacteria bacterium]